MVVRRRRLHATIGHATQLGRELPGQRFLSRFLRPNESERRYVQVSQFATVLLTHSSPAWRFTWIHRRAWQLLIGIGAGTGTVSDPALYCVRINAWSEVSAMTSRWLSPLLCGCTTGSPTTIRWSSQRALLSPSGYHCRLAGSVPSASRSGPGRNSCLLSPWFTPRRRSGTLARLCPDLPPARDFVWKFRRLDCGCVMIYSALFGIEIILKETGWAPAFLAAAAVAGASFTGTVSARLGFGSGVRRLRRLAVQ